MLRHVRYLQYVLKHKWFVYLACLQFRVPIWSAVLHDLDKFLPDEWFAYARTFYAPDGSKQYVESVDFARAWMLHQHRNKHHWQYWVWVTHVTENCGQPIRETGYLIWDRGEVQRVVQRTSGGVNWLALRPLYEGDYVGDADPMPDKARREMLADWFGAGHAIMGKQWTPLEPRKWYESNKEKMILHPDTRAWVEAELKRQADLYFQEEKLRGMGMIT